jgi:hypothetical protein
MLLLLDRLSEVNTTRVLVFNYDFLEKGVGWGELSLNEGFRGTVNKTEHE